MHAIYQTATGTLVSVGTVVADPLPAGLSAFDLGSDDRLLTGYGYWDAATRAVLDVVPNPGAAEANRATLTTARPGRPDPGARCRRPQAVPPGGTPHPATDRIPRLGRRRTRHHLDAAD